MVDDGNIVVGSAWSAVPGLLPDRFSMPPSRVNVRVGPASGSPQAPLDVAFLSSRWATVKGSLFPEGGSGWWLPTRG